MDILSRNKMLSDSKKYNYSDAWKPFLRQAFLASTFFCMYFNIGMLHGAPTVIIAQLRQANVTVTDNMASWLSSTFSYAGIPWIIILTVMAQILGRKNTTIFISLATIVCFIAFYFSTTITHLIITEALFGIPQGAIISISHIIIAEYSSPRYRGLFLSFKGASGYWGIWVSNAIGTFTYWRNISVVGFVISLWSLTICFCPESPYWLASKNRFAECRSSHRWLKGRSEAAEMELEKLIQSQVESSVQITFKDIRRREFYRPILVSLLPPLLFEFSGKMVIAIYAIDVLKKIINDNAKVYSGMLILDGVTVLSAYVGCFLIRVIRRRIILLTTAAVAICFLLGLSLYLYLVKASVCSENSYLSISLLAGFSVFVTSGPGILGGSLCGELIPGRYKSISVIVIAVLFLVMHATSLKLGPSIFQAMGLSGTLLFYSLGAAVSILLLYLYLPETKDKSLLEIEEHFRGKKRVDEGRNLVA